MTDAQLVYFIQGIITVGMAGAVMSVITEKIDVIFLKMCGIKEKN